MRRTSVDKREKAHTYYNASIASSLRPSKSYDKGQVHSGRRICSSETIRPCEPMKPFHKRFITLVRLELTRNLHSIIYFNLRGQIQDPKIKTIQSRKTAPMNLDLVNMLRLLDHKVCFLYSKVRISLT